jgi:hypothetical protein
MRFRQDRIGLLLPDLPRRLQPLSMAGPQQALLMGGGATGPTDPDFASVSLLLHMEGADAGTSFVDSSSNAHTMTAGGVTTSTAQAKFGGSSMLVGTAGNSNQLETGDHTTLQASTEDFTIEAWVYFNALPATTSVIYTKASGTGSYPYQLVRTTANKFRLLCLNSGGTLVVDITGTTTVTTGVWYFVQARRSGGTFALAVDGAQEATVTPGVSPTLFSGVTNTVIGNLNSTSAFPVVGYVDEVRFTKGVARAFTLPTAAFPNS